MFLVGIASFIVAMAATWIITPGVIRLARWLGAIDLPGGRKTHSEPVPRIGGLAVFFGFVVGMAFAAYTTGNLLTVPNPGVYWRGLALAATGLFLVGVADDLWGLSFYWKFAGQIVAATYVWSVGFRIEILTDFQGGVFELGVLSLPLTVLWIVGITNAVNLIDGLDGLAAGIALITTSAVATIAFASGRLGVTAASVVLAGSLVGFLRFNFNPARIFLGDSGSLFLGFVLAVTSVRGSQKGTTAVAILAPLLILGLPLLDTGLAVTRRLYRLGRRGVRNGGAPSYILRNINEVFLPDRGHIHHRLMDMGLSHRGGRAAGRRPGPDDGDLRIPALLWRRSVRTARADRGDTRPGQAVATGNGPAAGFFERSARPLGDRDPGSVGDLASHERNLLSIPQEPPPA
jgi:UDP-GlcNAc:undecaprenyl-phosphate GlcNAc-1-phosphate transferase